MCSWYWYLPFFGQLPFMWPTYLYLQQQTSPVSCSLTCTIASTDLDLQCFAKCSPCDIRNIFSEVLCDLFTFIPQFCLLGHHGHLILIEISFTNLILPMQIVLQPKMFLDFSLMTFMHRKSWYSPSMKTTTRWASTNALSTFTNASFAKAYSLSD